MAIELRRTALVTALKISSSSPIYQSSLLPAGISRLRQLPAPRSSLYSYVHHLHPIRGLHTSPSKALAQTLKMAESTHPSQHQTGEGTEGKHEWKTRPPYAIHSDNGKFPVLYDASCHCGQVKYQLSRKEPLDSKLCHCTTCQTQHGMSTSISST